MPEAEDLQATWLSVIGRSLAYLCLEQARAKEPSRFKTKLDSVKFLLEIGVPKDDAAYIAGSNPQSVRVMHHRKGRGGHGKKK